MMYKNLLLLSIFLLSLSASSQTIHRCITEEVFEMNAARYPHYKEIRHESFLRMTALSRQYAKTDEPDTIWQIPVVFHVVYKTADENIDSTIIFNQVEVLNKAYNKLNSDTANLRADFTGLAGNAGIEFVLATEDPQGNPTNGITRTQTNVDFFSFDLFGGASPDSVKFTASGGKDGWDPSRYLNIWVCNTYDPNGFGLVFGLAYPPIGVPDTVWPIGANAPSPAYEGVILNYAIVGNNNPNATGVYAGFDQGRTAVHEIGHFLGLRHIWGDGLGATFGGIDCDGQDFLGDGVDDTPTQGNNSQTTGCQASKNTCTDAGNDLPDLWENYMDYSEESCQVMFTHQQVELMRAVLTQLRPGLATRKGGSVSIMEREEDLFTLYPNPASATLTLQWNGGNDAQTITVTDMTGREVYTQTVAPSAFYTLPVAQLSAGMYQVQVRNGQTASIRRFIKQ